MQIYRESELITLSRTGNESLTDRVTKRRGSALPLSLLISLVATYLDPHQTIASLMLSRGQVLCRAVIVMTAIKLMSELLFVLHLRDPQMTARKLSPQSIYVEMNPQDAKQRGIRPAAEVVVESQRGKLQAKVFLTPTIRPGHVFIPMHFDTTNQLTLSHFDPYSKQPSYKNCSFDVRLAEAWDIP